MRRREVLALRLLLVQATDRHEDSALHDGPLPAVNHGGALRKIRKHSDHIVAALATADGDQADANALAS